MADLQTINRPLTRESVRKAHELIKPYIHLTPVLQCDTLSRIASTPQDLSKVSTAPLSANGSIFEPSNNSDVAISHPGRTANGEHTAKAQQKDGAENIKHRPANPKMNLFFKCENYQKIGAFKARGAFHALSRLTDGELENCVITHSSGNHAQALSLAAATRNIPAHIIMPTISTPSKIASTLALGAHVHFSGSTAPERERLVSEIQAQTGARLVPPYDHPDIILGQGTLALEFEQQVKELETAEVEKRRAHDGFGWRTPRARLGGAEGTGLDADEESAPRSEGLDAVIAPIGGGGMLSGVATALAGTGIAVFGAEPSFQGGDDCARGLAMSPPERVESVSTLTIADGLRTPVGVYPWSVISDREKVRGVFAVSEEEIKRAMRLIFERMKVVVEPSGAVGLAVVLFNEEFRALVERESGGSGWNVGVVLSGGNTTMEAIAGLFCGENGKSDSRSEGIERAEGTRGMNGERVAENVAG